MMTQDFVKILASAGHAAPSADNSQPMHFTWDGESLYTHYDTHRVSGHTFKRDHPATLIALGAALQNFRLVSDSYNLALKTELLFSDPKYDAYAASQLVRPDFSGEPLENHPVMQRQTNRFPYQKTAIPPGVASNLQALSAQTARVKHYSSPSELKVLADIVRSAAQVRFQIQEIHEWLGTSLRFDAHDVAKGDGMDVRTLDIPPGAASFLKFTRDWRRMSALNKLGAYRLMARIDSRPIKMAPAVIAICAPATASGAIDAGKLLSKTWCYANNKGLAVHPYYVVSDQLTRLQEGTIPEHLSAQVEQIKHLSRSFLELEGEETVHMLLRIGYPTREAPRSMRLPIEQVFTDLTVEDSKG